MGKPGFPIPLRGGGVGKPGFPTPLLQQPMFTLDVHTRTAHRRDEKRFFLGGRSPPKPSHRVGRWGNPVAPFPLRAGCARPTPPTGWGSGGGGGAPPPPRAPPPVIVSQHKECITSTTNQIKSNLSFAVDSTVNPVSDGLIAESPACRAAPRRPCSTRNRVSNLSSSRNTRSSLRDPSRLCLPCSVCHDFCSHISAEAVTMQCVDPR